MPHYLDPKNDLVFKRVFGEHPDLLISFLNALMPLEKGNIIESVEYLTPELVPENPLKKFSIVDVRCKDNRGRYFIVEMQMEWSSFFTHRILLNVSKVYSSQLDKGKNYNLLQPVYALGILNDNFDNKTDEYYHRYQLLNKQNTDEVIDGIEVIFVELKKFKPETVNDKKMSVLWLRFLKEVNEQNRQISEDLLKNPEINKAVEICEKGAFSDEELAKYDYYWDSISTEKAFLSTSYADGKAEGKVEGIVVGKVEGAREKAIQVVINSYKAGISIETIVLITQFSDDQVTAILKEQGLI